MNNKRQVSLKTILFSVFLYPLIWTQANAASVSYVLSDSNKLLDGIGYLSVMLTENGTGGVDFSVTTLDPLNSSAGGRFGIQSFAFNYMNGSPVIYDLPSGWSETRARRGRSAGFNMSEFGRFDKRVSAGGRNRTPSLHFTVDGVSLADFGSDFAAHVAGFRINGSTSAFFGGASLVTPPTASPVPVPPAMFLLASGILGLVAVARRNVLKGYPV